MELYQLWSKFLLNIWSCSHEAKCRHQLVILAYLFVLKVCPLCAGRAWRLQASFFWIATRLIGREQVTALLRSTTLPVTLLPVLWARHWKNTSDKRRQVESNHCESIFRDFSIHSLHVFWQRVTALTIQQENLNDVELTSSFVAFVTRAIDSLRAFLLLPKTIGPLICHRGDGPFHGAAWNLCLLVVLYIDKQERRPKN